MDLTQEEKSLLTYRGVLKWMRHSMPPAGFFAVIWKGKYKTFAMSCCRHGGKVKFSFCDPVGRTIHEVEYDEKTLANKLYEFTERSRGDH